MNLKKSSKFWVLKIAGKTYTSIPVLLLRSDPDLVLLVMPKRTLIYQKCAKFTLTLMSNYEIQYTVFHNFDSNFFSDENEFQNKDCIFGITKRTRSGSDLKRRTGMLV